MAEKEKKKSKNTKCELNIEETKSFLGHVIRNNRFLQQNGKMPIATEVKGESGIGKTSLNLQLANELGIPNFVKVNLAQIEELGDLVGFPIRQFEVCKKDDKGKVEECLWIDEHAVESYTSQGFKFTNKNRMNYCPPHWISGTVGGGILMLDDWNRADIRFIQAVMELIDRQTYISWSLPKDWHIILTANPEEGEYLVNSIDSAQRTRFMSVDLKFDVKCWARWAENDKIDNRCINFMLMHPELIGPKVNARSAVMFFNLISSVKDFMTELPLIEMCGEGSVGPEFATMFVLFINNKLDKIIAPETILLNPDTKYVINTLKSIIGKVDSDQYRADLASIIATRVINYSLFYAKDNTIDKDFIARLTDIINEPVFSNDICYNVVKSIWNGNQTKFKALTTNAKLSAYILK